MFLVVLLTIFCSCILIQCIHLLFMRYHLSRDAMPLAETPPPVTVIICANNEEENLKELIPALFGQDHPSFEVLVVDDRSHDGTHDYLVEASAKYRKLRYITVEHLPDHVNGKKYAITLAVKAARHELLLLTDADCRPASASWIRYMARTFSENTSFVTGHSMYMKEPGFLNLFIRYETLWTAMHFLSSARAGNPYMATGRNLAYLKQVFLENKGFRGYAQLTGGDDDLFVNRHARGDNTRVILEEDSFTWSVPKRTWREFLIQKTRHLSVGKYYRPASRFTLGVLSLSHIFGLLLVPVLIITPGGLWWGLGGYMIRTLLLHITLDSTGRKLKADIPLAWVTILDWAFVVYYLITGLSATFTKRIRWK